MAKSAKLAAVPEPEQEAQEYCVGVIPGLAHPLPPGLGGTLHQLEASLGMPLWVLSQCGEGNFAILGPEAFESFHIAKDELPVGKPIALLVESLGGQARNAYQIGRMLQSRCGGFVAVVPRAAMSAATLLVLGADRIIMGADASIGPLDAQVYDEDTENTQSALDEVQALERLRAHALESIDAMMFLLLKRTGKKIDSIMPHVLNFVAESNRPLVEQINVVHYNERARILKVAEEYGARLINKGALAGPDEQEDPGSRARKIARHLVEKYPEHGFSIDICEAAKIGLPVEAPTEEQQLLLDKLWYELDGINMIGPVKEVPHDPAQAAEGSQEQL